MIDKPVWEFIFITERQLRWRYRWGLIWFALKCLWNALCGHELSIERHEDSDE
jgi:hypothetical protein